MPLTATVSRNARCIATDDGKAPILPLAPANVINVGDIVCWDNVAGNTCKTPVTQADMAYYMGVADQQNPVSSLGDRGNSMAISRSGIFYFYATAADTYAPWAKVFFNETISVQTVTSNNNAGARTIAVGLYVPSQTLIVAGGNPTITGVAGALIQVWLTPYFPNNTAIPII
jgi:hypothetical protein